LRRSRQDLQLEQPGSLIEAAGVAGEDNWLFGIYVQLMGGGELHAVVAAQAKSIGKLTAGHARHGLCPSDAADRNGFGCNAGLMHLIGSWLGELQFDQRTGIAAEDH